MAKYGRGLNVELDDAPDFEEVDDVLVHVTCSCGEEMRFEMGDLLQLHVDGHICCEECGDMVNVKPSLSVAWEV